MSDRTPLPQQEIPGWYIKLQTDVLSQLPRPKDGMDKITAERWTKNNGVGLKKFLSGLVAPPKVELLDKRFHILETFDLYITEDIKELAPLLPKRSVEDAPTELFVGQKLKVDFIMIQDVNVTTNSCRTFLEGEGALLLGGIGALLIIKEQERLGKKNMRIPLCCNQWIASIGRGNTNVSDVYGVYSPDYIDHKLVSMGPHNISKQKGIFFLFCFRDAFD